LSCSNSPNNTTFKKWRIVYLNGGDSNHKGRVLTKNRSFAKCKTQRKNRKNELRSNKLDK
jgi:hypothetical protein